jgi:ribonuclease P protein component
MERLLKRRDFLKVQKGRRVHTGLFSVQVLPREERGTSRFGFTVSKRVDKSAVVRNRIRRRLKEAVRLDQQAQASGGIDFVLVAKAESLKSSFHNICSELARALIKAQRISTEMQAEKQNSAPTSAKQ